MFEPVAVFVDDEPHMLSTLMRTLRSQPPLVKKFTDACAAISFLETAERVSKVKESGRGGIAVAGKDAIVREARREAP